VDAFWTRNGRAHPRSAITAVPKNLANCTPSPLSDSNRRSLPYHGRFTASRMFTAAHERRRNPCKLGKPEYTAVVCEAHSGSNSWTENGRKAWAGYESDSCLTAAAAALPATRHPVSAIARRSIARLGSASDGSPGPISRTPALRVPKTPDQHGPSSSVESRRMWDAHNSAIATDQSSRSGGRLRATPSERHCSDAVIRRRAIAFTMQKWGDGGCGTGPLARDRLAPRRREITSGREGGRPHRAAPDGECDPSATRGARAHGRPRRLTGWADVLAGGGRVRLHHVAGGG